MPSSAAVASDRDERPFARRIERRGIFLVLPRKVPKMTMRTLTVAFGLAAGLVAAVLPFEVSAGPVLDKIKDQGVVQLCTNVNNPPFAFLAPSGEVQGVQKPLFDDVRAALSKATGKEIKLEIVPVLPSNRVQFLQQGKCDLILALTDTPERRKVIRFIEPGYFFDTPALVTRKDLTVAKWEDLKGKPVCSNTGSSYNPPLEQKFGATILAFQTQQEVDQSLRDGRCIGLISDAAFQQIRLGTDKDGLWKDYRIQDLQPYSDPSPASLAVNYGDDDLFRVLTEQVRTWHATGKTISLLEAHGLKAPAIMYEKQKSPN